MAKPVKESSQPEGSFEAKSENLKAAIVKASLFGPETAKRWLYVRNVFPDYCVDEISDMTMGAGNV